VVAPAHNSQVRRYRALWRWRRVELKLVSEFEGLKSASLDCRNYFGNSAGAEHYIDAEFFAHPLTFGQLREASHQPDGEVAAALLFAKFAEHRLSLFDGLSANGTRIDQNKIGFAEIIDERIAYASKL